MGALPGVERQQHCAAKEHAPADDRQRAVTGNQRWWPGGVERGGEGRGDPPEQRRAGDRERRWVAVGDQQESTNKRGGDSGKDEAAWPRFTHDGKPRHDNRGWQEL